MKKLIIVPAALGAALLLTQAYGQMGMMRGGMMGMSTVRHQFVMRNGIDPKYADKLNPLPFTTANIEAGKKLYEQDCASCHGPTGLGNGPAARGLNPPPANIAAAGKMRMATDSYLDWTISEGGAPLGTAMPPFKGTLTQDDIWKIIVYLRGL